MQENITLQQRGDVAINTVLKTGDVESVTVAAEAGMLQFNNAKLNPRWTASW